MNFKILNLIALMSIALLIFNTKVLAQAIEVNKAIEEVVKFEKTGRVGQYDLFA